MPAFDSFGDYLMTIQLINIIALLGGMAWWIKDGKPMDPTADDFPHKGILLATVAWLFWLVLLVVHLVYCLVIRDWLGVGIDVALLIWVWWDFFGGSGKWKKWKKRAKERVAVIKGRLKVIPIPAPSPA